MSDTPRFSVVVTTFNRRRLLHSCLDALLAQESVPGGHEIIVVDDGSRDATADLLRSLAGRVRALRQPNTRLGRRPQPRRTGQPRRPVGLSR